MDRFPGEQEAIDRMLVDAKKWGYGNFISVLRLVWRKLLMDSGLSEDTAMRASFETMPLHKDIDKLKEKVKKLKEAGTECVKMLNHYGPPAPDHVCGNPDARCDMLCVESAQFEEAVSKLSKLFKEK